MSLKYGFIHKSYMYSSSYLTSNKCIMMYFVLFSSIFGLLGCSKSTQSTQSNNKSNNESRETLSQAYGIWYALHAYKEKNGQLPDNLEMLAPEFLPTLDPPYSSPEYGWNYSPNINGYNHENERGSFYFSFYTSNKRESYYTFYSSQIKPIKEVRITVSGEDGIER